MLSRTRPALFTSLHGRSGLRQPTGKANPRPRSYLCLKMGEVLLKRSFEMLRQECDRYTKGQCLSLGVCPSPSPTSRYPELPKAGLMVSYTSLEQSDGTMTKGDSRSPKTVLHLPSKARKAKTCTSLTSHWGTPLPLPAKPSGTQPTPLMVYLGAGGREEDFPMLRAQTLSVLTYFSPCYNKRPKARNLSSFGLTV